MKNRQLALTLGSIITGILILFSSCKKINEATELGGDLIPPIDNINTFDTTITVEAYNDLFTLAGPAILSRDSTRTDYSDEQFLGVITNGDLLFGKTDARMYFELKPPSYKHTFKNSPDSLHIDSVVLVLDYVETYGDSTASQTITAYEINDPSINFRADTTYLVRENLFANSNLIPLGSKVVKPESLKDSIRNYKDTTARQLRITLSNAFGQRLLEYDTTAARGFINAYSSDSLFKSKFQGFALRSTGGGNALMGFNLLGTNTKLAIYYKDDNGNSAPEKWDTLVDYFVFRPYATNGTSGSASANFVERDYAGTPLLAAQGGIMPDPLVYIQNTPGTFATIKIPALAGLNNRVVHRAELIAEQVYDISDAKFPPPSYLFLDAYDPAISKYRTIPYDLIYDGTSGSFNFGSFGIAPVNAQDGLGNVVKTWHFNLTRYVQHVVNDTEPLYDLRLFAPLFIVDQYKPPVVNASSAAIGISINPAIAKGRVRLAGNTGPLDPNRQKMRLRIIYSKL